MSDTRKRLIRNAISYIYENLKDENWLRAAECSKELEAILRQMAEEKESRMLLEILARQAA